MASNVNRITKHSIAQGGDRTRNYQQGMFPTTRPAPDCYFATANHKGDITFANTRRISLIESNTAERLGSPQLRQYFRANPVAVDDVLCTHFLPGESEMIKLHIKVEKPIPGLVFDICIENNPYVECPDLQPEDFASNVGGVPVGTVIPIVTNFDAGVKCSWEYDVAGAVLAAGGKAPAGSVSPNVCGYMKLNDVLILKIKELPPEADPAYALACMDIRITPIMREFCRGFE